MKTKNKTATLFLTVLIFSFLSFSPLPSSSSSPLLVTFSKTTYANPYEVNLDLKVEIDANLPSELSSGQSKDVTIDVSKDWTTATLEYDPFVPQEKMFLTPLGDSSQIYLTTFLGELKYYIQLTNASVLMEINIEGNGTASPSSLLWSSPGSKSFTVSHTGSTSSKEVFTLRLSFKYVGTLTMLTTGEYGIIIDENLQEIELNGDQTISKSVNSVPAGGIDLSIITVVVFGLLIVLGISIAGIFYFKRRRSHMFISQVIAVVSLRSLRS